MITHSINTIFIGTSEEGVSSLKALIKDPVFNVKAVITQPDKPTGRKHTLTPSPIKQTAIEHGISIFSPQNNDDFYQTILNKVSPDLAISIAYGEFLPSNFLDSIKYKCLNVHYSLLPQLRGAVPVQTAILQGLEQTGISIQIMEKNMDTGPILSQKKIKISINETTPSLKKKLIPLGKNLLIETLHNWINQKVTPKPQDHSKATYCYKKDISKPNAQIDWNNMQPEHIERMVRALLPWPIAWTTLRNGKRFKIFDATIVTKKPSKTPRKLIIENNSVLFSTIIPDKYLLVRELQLEGKKRISAQDFAHGAKGIL